MSDVVEKREHRASWPQVAIQTDEPANVPLSSASLPILSNVIPCSTSIHQIQSIMDAARSESMRRHLTRSQEEPVGGMRPETGPPISNSHPLSPGLKAFHEWAWDILYLVLGFAAMVALVVLLACSDQKPLQPWVLGITLNSVIAVISLIWKACVTTICSECVGQIKWQWFQNKRDLIDMELFDDASRVGAAGVRRLLRIPWTRTRLAGLLIGLSMIFDPFIQQVVSFPTTTTRTESQDAQAMRGITYTMGPLDAKSVQADLRAGREDHYFASSIIPAVFYRESCYTKVYASAFNTCPSASNCTWDEFATLGLCYQIAELSEAAWQTDCEASDDSGCSYDIRGITQFQIGTNFVFESKEVQPAISQQWFNISNPILTLASMKRHNLDTVDYKLLNITVASLYPCVYTASASVVNGVYNFNFLNSWRNESAVVSSDLTAGLPDVFMAPTQDQLRIADNGKPFESATYYIPGPVADLIRTTLRSALVVRAGYSSNGSIVADFAYNGHGNSDFGAESFLTVGALWEKIFSSVVISASFYMRGTAENKQYLVAGYKVTQFTMIQVRWEWLTLPFVLFILTIVLFTITARKGRGLPAYKNSVLPLYFLPKLQDEDTLLKPFANHEMKGKARSTAVKFNLNRSKK